MPHTRFANVIREISLLPLEKEVINGCLLGDGTLSKSGKHFRLRVEHCCAHREYVQWKYDALNRLCASSIQYVCGHDSFRFGTVGHAEITKLRQKWYSPSKQVPCDLNITPITLAIWFMDDGTKHRDTVDISVHSFSGEDVAILQNRLLSMGIQTTINSDNKGKRMYVPKKSYPNFERFVKPHIVKCMEYKLP